MMTTRVSLRSFAKSRSRRSTTILTADLIMVDCGWQRETVMQACRESPHAKIVIPCNGIGVGSKDTPFAERRINPSTERKGMGWIWKPDSFCKQYHLQVDSNMWKAQTHMLFSAATGGPGSLSLFKAPYFQHEMYAAHLNAEFCDKVSVAAKGREVDEFSDRPGSPDNHHFDNTYNCPAGLAYLGCKIPESQPEEQPRRERRHITQEYISRMQGNR